MKMGEKTGKVYRPALISRLGSISAATLISFLVVLLLNQLIVSLQNRSFSNNLWRDLLIYIFLGTAAIFMLFSATHTYLVISPEGIEYHHLGAVFCTNWANIIAVHIDTLVLDHPADRINNWDWFARRSVKQITLLGFEAQLRNGELRNDIKHYAPHLKL
ncbi:MAG: hypothetical protein HYZ49_14795 [Chloroflexi bacterium]|nr:hypothetical protein [Chloroflexota bacterium]